MSEKRQDDEDQELEATVRQRMAQLQSEDDRVRLQFLKTELEACTTALQMGETELRSGTIAAVERELHVAQQGLAVIRKFLPKVRGEARVGIETHLMALEQVVERLREKVREKSRRRHG